MRRSKRACLGGGRRGLTGRREKTEAHLYIYSYAINIRMPLIDYVHSFHCLNAIFTLIYRIFLSRRHKRNLLLFGGHRNNRLAICGADHRFCSKRKVLLACVVMMSHGGRWPTPAAKARGRHVAHVDEIADELPGRNAGALRRRASELELDLLARV